MVGAAGREDGATGRAGGTAGCEDGATGRVVGAAGCEDGATGRLGGVLGAFITGPTGVGKSEVALLLAERLGCALLSVDSRQIYRRLEIGTAKPTPSERARVEHLLIDCLDPEEASSAGRYRAMALEALDRLAASGRRALAVGGTGFYWEALTRGLHPLPAADPKVRALHDRIAEEEGVAGLYRRLEAVDPETAARLPPNDRQRIARALEVAVITGAPMSRLLREERRVSWPEDAPPSRIPAIVLTRDRADLYRRIETRCRRMLEAGLIDEVRALLASGMPPDAPGLRTVGYREFVPQVLSGQPLEVCVEAFVRNSRRYAKRQETWFRHRLESPIELRIEAGETAEEVARRVEAFV